MPLQFTSRTPRVSSIIRPSKINTVLSAWGIVGGIVALAGAITILVATFLPWAQYRPLQAVNLWQLGSIDEVNFGGRIWFFVVAWVLLVACQVGYLSISRAIVQVWLVAASLIGWVLLAIGFMGVLAASGDLGPFRFGFYLAAIALVVVLAGTTVAWSSIAPSTNRKDQAGSGPDGYSHVNPNDLTDDRVARQGRPPSQATDSQREIELNNALRRLGQQRDEGQISDSEYELYTNQLRKSMEYDY